MRLKSNSELLHAQIFRLIQLMDKLIQDKWARAYSSASSHERRFSSKSLVSDRPCNSRTLPLAPLLTARYSPEMVTGATPTSLERPHTTPQLADMDTNDETLFANRNRNADYSQTNKIDEKYEQIIDAIITLPILRQATHTKHKLLHTQVATFKGKKTASTNLNNFPVITSNCVTTDSQNRQVYSNFIVYYARKR